MTVNPAKINATRASRIEARKGAAGRMGALVEAAEADREITPDPTDSTPVAEPKKAPAKKAAAKKAPAKKASTTRSQEG